MKYLFFLCLSVSIFSCSKDQDETERIASIIHHGGLGEDTLLYHYNANGQISYIENGPLTFRYIYENDRIILRNLFEHSNLLESDSISYDGFQNISKFIAHRFAYGSAPDERDVAEFTYQNNKLISARSQYADQAAQYDVRAEYIWAGNDITQIILRWSTDSSKFQFTYSVASNPYKVFGQQVWLLDPGFDFTRYENLHRVAYMSSGHCATGLVEDFGPYVITMQTNILNAIELFDISPSDEVIVYKYGPAQR